MDQRPFSILRAFPWFTSVVIGASCAGEILKRGELRDLAPELEVRLSDFVAYGSLLILARHWLSD